MASHPKPSPSHKSQQYLRTRVMTATPEQLQMMLYDGAVRFTEAGRAALDRRDREAVVRNLARAQAIVTELLSGLRPARGAVLCGRLAAEYRYVYRKLVEAAFHHNAESADAALSVLRDQRQSWAMLLEKRGHEKADGRARGLPAAPVVSAGLSIAA